MFVLEILLFKILFLRFELISFDSKSVLGLFTKFFGATRVLKSMKLEFVFEYMESTEIVFEVVGSTRLRACTLLLSQNSVRLIRPWFFSWYAL